MLSLSLSLPPSLSLSLPLPLPLSLSLLSLSLKAEQLPSHDPESRRSSLSTQIKPLASVTVAYRVQGAVTVTTSR